MSDAPTPHALAATYFDGQVAQARNVTLRLDAHHLHIESDGVQRSVPLKEIQWPERTRHGVRKAHLASGGTVQSTDLAAWDAWRAHHGHREPWLVTLQQSWRWVAVSVVVLVALLIGLQQWGLPLAARAVVAFTPLSVDESLGQASMSAIDSQLMRPSKLSQEEQTRLRTAFADALRHLPASQVPAWNLVFRSSRIGPNAFALPGGTIVMTDELVELVGGEAQVITAVLSHELGHVRARHGLRMLVQATVLGGVASAVLGDFSTMAAAVPVLIGQASYSRDAEREADAAAVQVLKAAGISPLVMVTLFEKLDAKRRSPNESDDKTEAHWLGIAFASHPTEEDRVRYFKDAAAHSP